MNMTNSRRFWARLTVAVGGLAMLVGALDPLEGSLVILPGCGLVTLGTFLGQCERRERLDWVVILLLVAVGVAVLFGLSALGGFGGNSGRSMWWGLLLLPYPVGWVMGIASLIVRLVRWFRSRRPALPAH